MLNANQILVRCIALAVCTVALGACGQRGDLYLPTGPEAQDRASLPDTVLPTRSAPTQPATQQ